MDRLTIAQHLAQAERHVVEGWRRIELQRDIVTLLQLAGYDSAIARMLLDTFEKTQAVRVADRNRLRQNLSEARY